MVLFYVTTVSDSYAEEIKTPYYGEHLDGLMRARSNCLMDGIKKASQLP